MDFLTLQAAKDYTDESLAGGGAIQGKPGPPGETPYIGENGNWWVGATDTGVSAAGKGVTDHAALTGRDQPDQHPIQAVTKLSQELDMRVRSDNVITALDIIKIWEG